MNLATSGISSQCCQQKNSHILHKAVFKTPEFGSYPSGSGEYLKGRDASVPKFLEVPYGGAVQEGCTGGAVVSALYCHVKVLDSIPGQGEIYMKNSVSAVCPAHSAVMSKLGLYLVKGKAAKE